MPERGRLVLSPIPFREIHRHILLVTLRTQSYHEIEIYFDNNLGVYESLRTDRRRIPSYKELLGVISSEAIQKIDSDYKTIERGLKFGPGNDCYSYDFYKDYIEQHVRHITDENDYYLEGELWTEVALQKEGRNVEKMSDFLVLSPNYSGSFEQERVFHMHGHFITINLRPKEAYINKKKAS